MTSRRTRRPPSLEFIFPPREPTPPLSNSENESEGENMDSAISSSSGCSRRPISTAQGPFCLRRPTLADILSNTAAPPYTLSAFMAYLSNNHCLETLEFTMDASRYRKHFNSLDPMKACGSNSCQFVKNLWQKLLDAYIAPNGPKEVNLPCQIKEDLLSVPNQQTPPPPETLDQAVNIIYELMEESVLMSFLNSVSVCHVDPWELHSHDDSEFPPLPPPNEMMPLAYSPTSSTGSRPKTISSFSAGLGWHRGSSHFPTSTEGSTSEDSLVTDESMNSANATPMTPPSTPPGSDSPISTGSPKHAKATEKSWKKVMGRLTWKRKDGLIDNRTL